VEVTDDFSAKLQGISWCAPLEVPPCRHTGRIDQSVSLAPGERKVFKATGMVRLDATGSLANRAYARTPQQTVWADDLPDAIGCTGGADLEVVKTGPATARPGDRITYTLTVTNHGPCTATGVRLVDPTPAQLVAVGPPLPGTLPDLAAGQSLPLSLQYDVRETCDPVSVNRATVSATETDPFPANNVSDFLTSIVRRADLAVTKTAPATVNHGDPLPYVLTVTNLGPDVACGVMLSDPIPSGLGTPVASCPVMANEIRCSIGQLAAGASRSFTVNSTAPATGPCASTITNTATVTAAPPSDPNPGNDAATAVTLLTDDLSITKTDGLVMAAPGQVLLYTITVANPDACQATVKDAVPPELSMVLWCRDTPSGPCVPFLTGNLSDVEMEAAATYRVQGMVLPTFAGTLANTATVAGPSRSVDPDPWNNSATDTTEIVPAGVTVSCQGIAGTLAAGGTVTYTFVLRNGGPNAQGDNPGSEFSDLLPAGLTPVAASASSGVVLLGNPVTWNGAIPVGGMVTITIKVMIAPNTLGQTFCNGATIAFDRDGNGSNESSGGVALPCCFQVQPPNVPALSAPALGLLALLLALVAVRSMARRGRPAAD
jgi:uncharacterized repeat protein (TIGR01451 family)